MSTWSARPYEKDSAQGFDGPASRLSSFKLTCACNSEVLREVAVPAAATGIAQGNSHDSRSDRGRMRCWTACRASHRGFLL